VGNVYVHRNTLTPRENRLTVYRFRLCDVLKKQQHPIVVLVKRCATRCDRKTRSTSPVVSGLQVGGAHCLGDMAGRAKVDDLDPVGLSGRVHQHDVLRLQVGVDQTQTLQLLQSSGDLHATIRILGLRRLSSSPQSRLETRRCIVT